MAIDSQSFSPPSSMAGILPFGLMARYSGAFELLSAKWIGTFS